MYSTERVETSNHGDDFPVVGEVCRPGFWSQAKLIFEVDLGISIPTREQVYLDLVLAIRAITTLAVRR